MGCPKAPIFRFKLVTAAARGRQYLDQLFFTVARGSVLRTIPIERLDE